MRAGWWLVAVAAVGCGRRGSLYDGALAPLPLVATSSALVQIVPETRRAVIVTPGATTPSAVTIGADARVAARVPGAEAVAILSGSARSPRLELLELERREVTSLELTATFDRLTFSPEGRFALMTADAQRTAGVAARNLNEAALLDVAARAVTRVQLDVEGLAPRLVAFGPAEATRRLVAVALERGVAIFDATRPEVPARRVSLQPPGSTAEGTVEQLLFSRDARWLFLRASGLDDVVVLELGAETGRPVSASINFVAGGTGLVGLSLPPAAAGASVLALFAGSAEVALLDARGVATDSTRRLALPAGIRSMERLSGRRMVRWGGQTAVVWDVLDGRSGVAALLAPSDRVLIVEPLERALMSQQGAGAGATVLTALSVSEEPNRLRVRAQPIQLARAPSAVSASPDGSSVFLAVPTGIGAPAAAVVTIDVRTLALSEVLLDAPVADLHPLLAGGVVAAEHGGNPLGDVSLFPAGSTERLSVTRLSDFALTGDLDRPGDRP